MCWGIINKYFAKAEKAQTASIVFQLQFKVWAVRGVKERVHHQSKLVLKCSTKFTDIAVLKSNPGLQLGNPGPQLGNPGPELKVENRKMNNCMNVWEPFAVF